MMHHHIFSSAFKSPLSLKPLKILLSSLLIIVMVGSYLPTEAQKRKSSPKSRTTQTTSTKKTAKKKTAAKAKTKTKANTKPATSAEAKRRQAEAQKEIARTKEEIRRNEAEVKKGLNELNRLNSEIATGRSLVTKASEQVQLLDNRISGLESDITAAEAQLAKMREDYLRSVKKIRAKKNSNSDLAFIFSSKNFSQAMRRMRYLKQISAWRTKKSAEISASVKELSRQKEILLESRRQKDLALSRQIAAQNRLNTQYQRQDALVGELRRNGQALNSHLARKQKEANALKATIAALIAEENRKAEEARKAVESRRKAEEERLLAQEQAKEQPEKGNKGQETDKTQDKKKKTDKSKDNNKKDYAEARHRKPRSVPDAGNFAAMRGLLPRPVAGAFRVTSQFGRHSLPELPDVMYDNPGIDAETSAGASAQAVYGGKVSGVYVIPGFSTVVIVNHGNYYTVYGNIASPAVKVGDAVKQGQALGKLTPSEEDPSHSSIHFEVWKNRDKLNPLDWIR